MRRLLSAFLTLLGIAALAPAGAAAANPQPPDCPLLAPRTAVDHPLTLPDATKVVARDPYGGLLSRNRLFFDFALRNPGGGAPSGVAAVTWALDGTVVRTDPKPPYEWTGLSGSDRRMPAGDHQFTVSVAPAGGGGRTGERSYRLRVPRTGTTLLRRGRLRVVLQPAARRFLTVTGLPDGVRALSVRLVGRGARGLLVKRPTSANRCRYRAAAAISGPRGRVVVSGGAVSGLCR